MSRPETIVKVTINADNQYIISFKDGGRWNDRYVLPEACKDEVGVYCKDALEDYESSLRS